MLVSTQKDIPGTCTWSHSETQEKVDVLYEVRATPSLPRLEGAKFEGSEVCTTGDAIVDRVLGGGIRPGMIWEISGESAAGKTQLAAQLSLFVQLPKERGGLSGSTCYLTTSSRLPTPRFAQILRTNPSLSGLDCNLDNIHTVTTHTVSHLVHVLSQTLPSFVSENQRNSGNKPLKLLIIDALAELFHISDKTTTTTLVERAKDIVEIATLLHSVAQKHKLAVVVLNQVFDVFERDILHGAVGRDVSYNEQSLWFGQAQGTFGEVKEVSLGLVWANQVNVRIFLSRTHRRRHMDETDNYPTKRRKADAMTLANPAFKPTSNDPTLIRRLSVIFSPLTRPAFCDYIVTESGISTI